MKKVWLSSPLSVSDTLKLDVCAELLSCDINNDSPLHTSTHNPSKITVSSKNYEIGFWTTDKKYSDSNLEEADLVVFFVNSWKLKLPVGCKREYEAAKNLGKKIKFAYKPSGRNYTLYDCKSYKFSLELGGIACTSEDLDELFKTTSIESIENDEWLLLV